MKYCLIVLPYIEYMDEAQLKAMHEKADITICADGGQDVAYNLGIEPDVVIGDFDSSESQTEHRFKCEYLSHPVEKDFTDAEACLHYAMDNGCTNIVFYGGMGGRFDHTLGALTLLIQGSKSFARVRLVDGRNIVEVIRNTSVTLHKNSNYSKFGIMPLYEEAHGVSIKGAKYSVSNIDMFNDRTLGIGNEIVDESAVISVRDGSLYVARYRED